MWTVRHLTVPESEPRLIFQQVRDEWIPGHYRPAGSGLHGSVWVNREQTHAIKIYYNRDRGYTRYLKAVRSLDHANPYTPVIRHETRISASTGYADGVTLLSMEYLCGIPESVSANFIRQCRAVLEGNSSPMELDYYQRRLLDLIADIIDDGSEFYLDLHRDNVRQRGSQMVVTDPVGVFSKLVDNTAEPVYY